MSIVTAVAVVTVIGLLGAAILLLLLVMLNFRIISSLPGRAVLPAREAAPA